MTNTWDFRATKSATDCKWLGMSSSESESVRDPIQFHSEFCECLKCVKISICSFVLKVTLPKLLNHNFGIFLALKIIPL